MTSYNTTVLVRTHTGPEDLVDALAGRGYSPAVSPAPPEFDADLEVVLTVQTDHLTRAIAVATKLLVDVGCDPRWVTACTTAEYDDAWLEATA